jgi:beta-N-acetylhexosaminidase
MLEEKVGQLFVASFRRQTADPAFLAVLERRFIGGVTLYARNCKSGPQVKKLISQLHRASRFPLLVSVDQEGGLVTRIHSGVHTFPAEAAYGSLGSAARVFADAATTAHDLRALGLTMNFAPVVDILTNPNSPIGTRSYGSDPHLVARLSVAAINGYQQHGLAATARHFIGLGHTSIDSHQALPTVNLTLAQLEQNDLIPFHTAIGAGVSTVLVAHVALPAIDRTRRPASLSPVVLKDVLRRRLRFRGVVITDSLLMDALPQSRGMDTAVQAFAAGSDLLVLAANHDFPLALVEDAIARMVSAVKTGKISEGRHNASVARIQALKNRYTRRPPPIS